MRTTSHTGATARWRIERRDVLRWGGLAAATAVVTGCSSKSPAPAAPGAAPTPSGAAGQPTASAGTPLSRLQVGNARFVAGGAIHPDQGLARRSAVASGQQPFAQVLCCIDSRVAPEVIFDQGLGDLLVTRSAGQVLDHAVVGSLQFGVAELKIPLLLVLGHERCGAVKATVEAVEKHSPPAGSDLDALVRAIRPAVETAVAEHAPDVLDAAIWHNVENVTGTLNAARVLAPAVKAGTLQIVSGRYDLDTGVVEVRAG